MGPLEGDADPVTVGAEAPEAGPRSPPDVLRAIRLANAECVFGSVGILVASVPLPVALGPKAWSSPFKTAAALPRSIER